MPYRARITIGDTVTHTETIPYSQMMNLVTVFSDNPDVTVNREARNEGETFWVDIDHEVVFEAEEDEFPKNCPVCDACD